MSKLKYSSVNFKNLIQDLVDMYPFNIPEVIITELVSNSLDAKADEIDISFNKEKNLLIVEDNGTGMTKRQFDQYHDFAAGLKARGDGIGFAGLGAKISFSIASRVQTETSNSKFKGRSNWYLKSPKELVWEQSIELSELNHDGTRVEVYFNEEKETDIFSEIAAQAIQEILFKHFLTLFDKKFLDIYDLLGFYGKNLRFKINNNIIKPFEIENVFKLSKVKKVFFESDGKRYGYGIFGISDDTKFIKSDTTGIGLSVYGKIIQHDFFGQFPGELASKIFGILEVPPFVKFLNTSKTGFIKSRGSSLQFNKFYEPLRENFKIWLNEIGIKSIEAINTEEALRLEQEVKKLLLEIPEVNNLFDLKSRTNVLVGNDLGDIKSSYSNGASKTSSDKSYKAVKSTEDEKNNVIPSKEDLENSENNLEVIEPLNSNNINAGKDMGKNISKGIYDIGSEQGKSLIEDLKSTIRSNISSRRKKAGFKISFADRDDRADLAWIEKDIIVINSSHPSYLKVRRSSAGRKIHNLFSIAIALSREMQDQGIIKDKDLFIDEIMSKWGKIKI
jgi:hypothetical protein